MYTRTPWADEDLNLLDGETERWKEDKRRRAAVQTEALEEKTSTLTENGQSKKMSVPESCVDALRKDYLKVTTAFIRELALLLSSYDWVFVSQTSKPEFLAVHLKRGGQWLDLATTNYGLFQFQCGPNQESCVSGAYGDHSYKNHLPDWVFEKL